MRPSMSHSTPSRMPESVVLMCSMPSASNTAIMVFKAGMVAFLGAPSLRRVILAASGVILIAAALAAWAI